MKKYLAVILAVMLLLTMLSACKKADEGNNDTSDPTINQNDDTKNDTQGDPTGEDKNDTTEPEPTVDENDNNDNNDDNNDTTDPTIQITEKFTYEDPADLEYDARYVIYADTNCLPVANTAGALARYEFYFADAEDAAVAIYTYWIFESDERAEKYISNRPNLVASVMEEDPCVVFVYTDAAELAETINMYHYFKDIDEPTVSAYVNYLAETINATLM